MEDIIGDIFISICSTLKSIDKINLTSTNKKMYSKQSTICYNDLMYIDQIIHHKLYHNFTRVLFEAPLKFDEMKYYCGYEIPLCVLPQNIKAMYINHKMHIPSGVTELF